LCIYGGGMKRERQRKKGQKKMGHIKIRAHKACGNASRLFLTQ